jgi:hypothetical protein
LAAHADLRRVPEPDDPDDAPSVVRALRLYDEALAHGVACVMPNIERPSAKGQPGWVVDDAARRAPQLLRKLGLAPARAEAASLARGHGITSTTPAAFVVTRHSGPGVAPQTGRYLSDSTGPPVIAAAMPAHNASSTVLVDRASTPSTSRV